MRKRSRQGLRELFLRVAAVLLAATGAAGVCAAQSGDLNFPTPIFSNEVTGRIAPRDVGDPRRTRHFYTFRGVEGDLVVNLESSELTGDVDVFTATTSRPLAKITLLGGTPTRASKSVYLRAEETLILRVEARAVGDAEGTYRIRLEGAFAPAPTSLADTPEPSAPTVSNTERRGKGTRRVTSTGARIEEPAPPAEEAKAEPTPTPTPGDATAAEGRAGTRESTPAPRRGRGTRPPSRRSRGRAAQPQPPKPEEKTDTARTETPTSESAPADAKPEGEAPAATRPARTPRRRGSRATPSRSSPRERADTTPAEPAPPAPSQRLIIVTRDGETQERDMNTVRRVTVENNQVVVVTKDGKTIRTPMANVLKMSIEP